LPEYIAQEVIKCNRQFNLVMSWSAFQLNRSLSKWHCYIISHFQFIRFPLSVRFRMVGQRSDNTDSIFLSSTVWGFREINCRKPLNNILSIIHFSLLSW
jgi:hypothetical protein